MIANRGGSRIGPKRPPINTTLTLALALGAIVPSEVHGRPAPAPASRQTVEVIRVSAPRGFDWADAGIGAAGGFGISMLAVGGALAIADTQRRARVKQATGCGVDSRSTTRR